MPKFSYLARKGDGGRESGVIESRNKQDAIAILQKKDLLVTSIIQYDSADKGKKGPGFLSFGSRKKVKKFKHTGVKFIDLVILARQLAMLLSAGVSLLKALEVIRRQVDSKRLHDVLSDISKNMEAGHTFKDSLVKHKRVFSDLWLFLVETGEASGNLPTVLDHLAKYLEERESFKQKIFSALMYPAVLLLVSVGAILFFVIKIVPTFVGILSGLNVKLPLPTQILISISNVMKKYFLLMIGAAIIIWFIFDRISRYDKVKRAIEMIQLKLPLFGSFFSFMMVENFATTMSILIESGVPIIYALDICERSQPSKSMQTVIRDVKNHVRDGKSLATPLENSGFFAPMVIQMITIGEEIGELSEMFKRIAKFYQEYLGAFVTRFASLFEPLMIVFMGVIIGAMVISIFLPIFQLATASAR